MKHSFLFFTVLFILFPFVCQAGGGSITADFSASSSTINVGETVSFTSSTNFIVACNTADFSVTYTWNFGDSATPPNYVQTDGTAPHNNDNANSGNVSYSTPGQKTITLEVAHSNVSCNTNNPDTKTMLITVVAAIPTLSEWALILLALLLMNFGAVAIAQEQLSLASSKNYSLPFTRFQMPFSAAHFNKGIVLTAIFVLIGFAASIFLTGTIAASDLIGVFVTAPVFAYLVHLLWILKVNDK